MAIASAADLVDVLRRHRLLAPPQLQELDRLLAAFPEPRLLGKQLLQLGWLTLYQASQLLSGRGPELILGPYLILDRLGAGGNGQVFKARHQSLQRLVALKILRAELQADAEAVGRFYREIEVVSQIAHPHIVHAYDAGPVGASLILAMEYIDGVDMDRLVKESGPLPVPQACAYIQQAAWGLQHAHEKGLIHRDMKPSNLLVSGVVRGKDAKSTRADHPATVKILDLGLARLQHPVRGSRTADLTKDFGDSGTHGTPDYMAPEQALDFHGAGIPADIYGLGCTLYFLLAGQPPFAGGSFYQKLLRHQQEEPAAIDKQRSDLPAGLGKVLQRMLAKRPQDRYQTAGAVAEALTAWLPPSTSEVPKSTAHIEAAEALTAWLPPSARLRACGPRRRHRTWLVAGILAGLALLGGSAAMLELRQRDTNTALAGTSKKLGETPARPNPERAEKDFVNSWRMKMVHIPDGKFMMGAAPGEPRTVMGLPEQDLHEVVISKPFYMAAHDVTVGQFRAFAEATGPRPATNMKGKSWQAPGFDQTDDHPVVLVTWDDALAFCRWLSQKEGRVYRLPTEAEWEFACRAGKQTTYFFGNDARQLGEYAWYNGNAKQTQPVGRLKANAYGLYDMLGNVWQWTADAVGNQRVLRGGSYTMDPSGCRCATRKARETGHSANHHGFRAVCDP